jgi:hypothetical protein
MIEKDVRMKCKTKSRRVEWNVGNLPQDGDVMIYGTALLTSSSRCEPLKVIRSPVGATSRAQDTANHRFATREDCLACLLTFCHVDKRIPCALATRLYHVMLNIIRSTSFALFWPKPPLRKASSISALCYLHGKPLEVGVDR